MIERSRTTTTMSGRQIRKPSIFKRSKSMNDKNNHGTDNLGLDYRFNLSFYDGLNSDNINRDDWNYYRSLSEQNDTSNYTTFPINQNNYRKLSDHRNRNEYSSYEKNSDPVPNHKRDMIEKMNDTLDNYNYYISNNGNDYFSTREGDAYGMSNYERKDSNYNIEDESCSSNRKKDTYYNVLENYYDPTSSVVVINPDVRPPVPARYRYSNDKNSRDY